MRIIAMAAASLALCFTLDRLGYDHRIDVHAAVAFFSPTAMDENGCSFVEYGQHRILLANQCYVVRFDFIEDFDPAQSASSRRTARATIHFGSHKAGVALRAVRGL